MKLPSPKKRKAMIAKAIEIAGTQEKLATKSELSQQAISRLLNDDDYGVSASAALKIEAATDGEISRYDLRPDLYGKAA